MVSIPLAYGVSYVGDPTSTKDEAFFQ